MEKQTAQSCFLDFGGAQLPESTFFFQYLNTVRRVAEKPITPGMVLYSIAIYTILQAVCSLCIFVVLLAGWQII